MTTPYSQRDHYHCFDNKNPPCGQKIQHLVCCLCEVEHPRVAQAKADGRREMKEEILSYVREENWHAIEGANGMCACGDVNGNCKARLMEFINSKS